MTADGHPDLSGLWNVAVPMAVLSNEGIEVGANSARDTSSDVVIAMFPGTAHVGNDSDIERANALLRRMGSDKPVYKPEYWARVQNFDNNSNEMIPLIIAWLPVFRASAFRPRSSRTQRC